LNKIISEGFAVNFDISTNADAFVRKVLDQECVKKSLGKGMEAVSGAIKLFFTNGSTVHVGADEFKIAAKKAFTPLDQSHWSYGMVSSIAQTVIGLKMMGVPPLDTFFGYSWKLHWC